MKALSTFLIFLTLSNLSYSAEILYRQSFENPISESPEIQWETRGYAITQVVVDHDPKDGNKSVRGNFNKSVKDPFTGLWGEPFVQFKINFNKVPALKDWLKTTNKVYVSWWFKLDVCHWAGPAYSNDDPLRTTGKFAFIRMNEHPETAYYFTANGGSKGQGTLSANSWNNLWQNWYKRPSLVGTTGNSWGSDGRWHKLSFYIGKKDNGQKYLMWWIDDFLVENSSFELDGKFNIFNDFVMDSIQFWHMKTTDVSESINLGVKDNICNGWQIDDVQVWTDIPSNPKPPYVDR